MAMSLMAVSCAKLGGYVPHRTVLLMLKSCPIRPNKCKLFGVSTAYAYICEKIRNENYRK